VSQTATKPKDRKTKADRKHYTNSYFREIYVGLLIRHLTEEPIEVANYLA